eukprot:2084302-Prymnesium_polylepis.1
MLLLRSPVRALARTTALVQNRCAVPERRFCNSAAEPEEVPSTAARFKVTVEVCVSKIGPAGAGWWAANALAD